MNTRDLVFAVCALWWSTNSVHAQDYPARPIRVIVPAGPGGGPDVTTRIVTTVLSQQMGIQLVVDNRPGGSGVIGTELIARASPDGYTIGQGNFPTLVTNRHVLAKLPYDPDRDLQLVSQINWTFNILAVSPALPVKSVRELIEYARKYPGKVLFASSGVGTSLHLTGELLKRMTGTQMIHVPYKSAQQGVTDLITGQVQVMFDNAPSIGVRVRAGRVHGLAVTTLRRSPAYPDLPTVAESGVPDFEFMGFSGIVAPSGLSKTIVNRLNAEVNRALASTTVKDRYAAIGNQPTGGTPEAFAALVRREVAKWGEVIKGAGIRAD